MRFSTCTVLTASLLPLTACWLGSGGGTNNPAPADGKTAVFLEFNNTFDQPGDDDGGAKQPVDVPIVWSGARVGGEGGPGETFSQDDTFHGFATDPWHKTTIVTNLEPGDWNLAVNVNGLQHACASPITLASGVQVNVTFQIDKDSGVFAGCTHN